MDYRIQHKIKSAKEFEQQGKFLHSIQIYKSLIDEYPDYYDAYLHLAEIYEQIGNRNAAKSVFVNVMSREISDTDLKMSYGQFLIRNAEWKNAIDIFKKISVDDEPICSYFIGYLYLLLNSYEDAKLNLLKFVISDEQPELICDAYFFLAKSEFELRQYENSLKYAAKAEILLSGYWELYVLFAKSYFSLSMYSHAMKSITKAANLNRKEPLIQYWAGKIFFRSGELEKSTEYYTTFLELSTGVEKDKLIENATKLLQIGKLKEALINFQKAEFLESYLIASKEELLKSNKNY